MAGTRPTLDLHAAREATLKRPDSYLQLAAKLCYNAALRGGAGKAFFA